jgi:hypothetical protein
MTSIDASAVQNVADRVEALGEFSETVDRVIAQTNINLTEYRDWRDIVLPNDILEIRVTSIEGDVLDDDVFAGGVRIGCQIDLRKVYSDKHVRFLSVSGFERFLQDDQRAATVRRVSNARQRSHFASATCSFDSWQEGVDEPVSLSERSPDPRQYVRDLSSARLVTPSIIDAIATQIPADEGDVVWQTWRRYAMVRIAVALASEVLPGANGNAATLCFRSNRTTSVLLEAGDVPIDITAFRAANDLATWVYVEGNDCETRHILVANAISDEWTGDLTWSKGIASAGILALETAKSGYQLHLADVSSDALKALGDLRKSLYDDIPKMLQQTRDLSNGLWRDFAVALAVVLTQLSRTPPTLIGSFTLARLALWGVAVYLVASIAIALLTAARFRKIESDARDAWLERVYRFVGQHERDALAKTPYAQAAGAFRGAMWAVTGSYLVLVIVLLLLGLSSTAPAPASSTFRSAAPKASSSTLRATPRSSRQADRAPASAKVRSTSPTGI